MIETNADLVLGGTDATSASSVRATAFDLIPA